MALRSTEKEGRPKRSVPGTPFSGLGWAALALVSGVALIVAVVVNLQRVVEQRGEQALWVAARTEDLGAKSLRRSILDPALLDQVAQGHTFDWQQGRVIIPAAVGWLVPDPDGESGGMDALAKDLVQRAQAASGTEAEALWKRALQDPGVPGAALDALRMQAAWFAHRENKQEWCDGLLEAISERAGPQTQASMLLLFAIRNQTMPEQALQIFEHLEPDRARALLERLQERGLELPGSMQACQEQSLRRAELRRLLPLENELAKATEPNWHVVDQDCLAVIFPEQQQGVWLDLAALRSWAGEHAGVPVELVSSLEPLADGQRAPVEVIPGFVSVRLPLQGEPSVLSGPVLLAALVVALAALCGGGAWFALRSAGREAQAARLKGEFLTTVTHELKTPLAGIRLVSELLADGHVQDPDKRRGYLQALSAESTRLSMLIENVLDLRRMESGERVHDAQPEDFGELLKATVELFAPLLERSGNQVLVSGLDTPLRVLVDRDDLRQAFLNLLDNARKYGGQGDIQVKLTRVGERAVLRLLDGGPGIDPAERETIFGRFVRGKQHQHGGIPGVGIGLNLARAILRRQGGELIACDPPAGQSGACFELSLPLHTNINS